MSLVKNIAIKKLNTMKQCFKCKVVKPLADFYRHKEMADGHLNKCKECQKLDVAIRYSSPEGRLKVTEYERKRTQTSHRKAKCIEYLRNQRSRSPEKYKARTAVSNAVRDGRLIKQPCEICRDDNSQAHHSDYSRPLAVRWFCFKHHREVAHKHKTNA
jgi:hypothetical protein